MHRKYNKFLIVSILGFISLGVYSYFYNDLKSEAASSDSAITSSLGTTSATTNNANSNTAEDTAFLDKLKSLTTIKVDTSLLTDKSFTLLVDNNIKLDPVPYGRINPFSPTDNLGVQNNLVPLLKTNPATGITARSVILNGSLEGTTSNNIYFEYGIDQNFGKVTPKLTASLIGNFSSTIILLNPKTTYYYRAVAVINGVLTSGQIMSFNTN